MSLCQGDDQIIVVKRVEDHIEVTRRVRALQWTAWSTAELRALSDGAGWLLVMGDIQRAECEITHPARVGSPSSVGLAACGCLGARSSPRAPLPTISRVCGGKPIVSWELGAGCVPACPLGAGSVLLPNCPRATVAGWQEVWCPPERTDEPAYLAAARLSVGFPVCAGTVVGARLTRLWSR